MCGSQCPRPLRKALESITSPSLAFSDFPTSKAWGENRTVKKDMAAMNWIYTHLVLVQDDQDKRSKKKEVDYLEGARSHPAGERASRPPAVHRGASLVGGGG